MKRVKPKRGKGTARERVLASWPKASIFENNGRFYINNGYSESAGGCETKTATWEWVAKMLDKRSQRAIDRTEVLERTLLQYAAAIDSIYRDGGKARESAVRHFGTVHHTIVIDLRDAARRLERK